MGWPSLASTRQATHPAGEEGKADAAKGWATALEESQGAGRHSGAQQTAALPRLTPIRGNTHVLSIPLPRCEAARESSCTGTHQPRWQSQRCTSRSWWNALQNASSRTAPPRAGTTWPGRPPLRGGKLTDGLKQMEMALQESGLAGATWPGRPPLHVWGPQSGAFVCCMPQALGAWHGRGAMQPATPGKRAATLSTGLVALARHGTRLAGAGWWACPGMAPKWRDRKPSSCLLARGAGVRRVCAAKERARVRRVGAAKREQGSGARLQPRGSSAGRWHSSCMRVGRMALLIRHASFRSQLACWPGLDTRTAKEQRGARTPHATRGTHRCRSSLPTLPRASSGHSMSCPRAQRWPKTPAACAGSAAHGVGRGGGARACDNSRQQRTPVQPSRDGGGCGHSGNSRQRHTRLYSPVTSPCEVERLWRPAQCYVTSNEPGVRPNALNSLPRTVPSSSARAWTFPEQSTRRRRSRPGCRCHQG